MMHLRSQLVNHFPTELAEVLQSSLEDPPLLAREGYPLSEAPIDHLAVAVESPVRLRSLWVQLTEPGARTIEPVHLWPDEIPGCPTVAEADKKWMTTLDVGPFLLVLLAPHSDDDIVARFLQRIGSFAVHHMAFAVQHIGAALEECLSCPAVAQISSLAEDPYLSQVFLRSQGDHRITELIQRAPGFSGTFTCRNIAALTRGERMSYAAD